MPYIPESEALRQAGIWAGEGKYSSLEPGYAPTPIDRMFNPGKVRLYEELIGNQKAFEGDYKKFNAPFFKSIEQQAVQPYSPTLGQFAGVAGRLPSGFAESSQIVQQPLGSGLPIGQDVSGAPIVPTGPEQAMLNQRFGPMAGFEAFNPQARMTPAQLSIASPVLEQKAIVSPEGQIMPTALVPEPPKPLAPQGFQPGQPILTQQGWITAPGTPAQKPNEKLEEVKSFMNVLGIDPSSAEGQKYIKNYLTKVTTQAQAPSATATIKQETTIEKGIGEDYLALQKAGSASIQKMAKFERMRSLLQGIETGKLTPAITEVQALGQSLGFPVDASLPAKQAVEALSNEIALELRNTGSGAGMPGQLSDKDREFLVSMTPNLSKTPEGNRLIIETRMALLKREQEVARIARDYRKKHGKVDEGLYDEIQRYANKHPLFVGKKLPTAAGVSGQKKVLKFDAQGNLMQ